MHEDVVRGCGVKLIDKINRTCRVQASPWWLAQSSRRNPARHNGKIAPMVQFKIRRTDDGDLG
jgi:hypothetical protein